MFSRRHAVAVLCAATLVACDRAADPITGPAISADLIADLTLLDEFLPGIPVLDPFSHQGDDLGVLESARGGAMTTFAGEQRTFAFTAKNRTDGTQGQFQLVNRATGFKQHGRVTCLEVEGNVAWVGGITEQTNNPAFEGIAAIWQLVDDGEGSDSQDLISFAFLAAPPWDQTCHGRPSLLLNNVEEGNVQVDDAP
jgi:hypothetical protein